MKRKIIISLLALLLFFAFGAVISIQLISHSTAELDYILNLHHIEQMRKSLVTDFRTVQADLHSLNESFSDRNSLSVNLVNLNKTAHQCTTCHHPPELEKRIKNIQTTANEYANRINDFMSIESSGETFVNTKKDIISFGDQILTSAANISHHARDGLDKQTAQAIINIKHVQSTLIITMITALVLSIMVAITLIRFIIKPINALVTATRKISSGELGATIRYKDNTEFGELAEHFNMMSKAVKDGYENMNREVEERRQTEEALVKSEKFLNTIFDSIRDPFCIFDKEHKIVKANDAYAELKQKRFGELYGAKCYEALYSMDSKCNDCIVDTTFRSKDPCAKDKLITMDDGTKIWLDIYTYPIYDELGDVTCVIEYIRDVSERKRTETALKESQERYALAARGTNDGMWDWNLGSDSIYYSPRWKHMLGLSENHFTESPDEWFSRIHPDDQEELKQDLDTHIGGKSVHFENEHRLLHKDGTYRWMQVRGVAVRENTGKAYRIVGSMTDVTERKEAEQQLIFDALHDALTGLPNRLLFMDRLMHAIDREKRNTNYLFAVLFMDINRFKVLNDSMGHTIGDEMLVSVSQRLEECLRIGDTVARFGGDEFAILLEDLKDEREALSITKRINEMLTLPFYLQGQEIYTSTSIGIVFSSTDYDKPEHLIRNADIAMYHAKTNKRSSYEVFNNKMYADAVARLAMETDLRTAIRQNDFKLLYQPIVSVTTGTITGLEALIRWNHPVHGVVSPNRFIPVAEDTGLILDIGEWVLSEACLQLQQLQRQLPLNNSLTMSVNISSKQLFPSLLKQIKKILHGTGLTPSSLMLEITETMIMENTDIVFPLLFELKKIGVKVNIDDFGTGYSSLSHLHDLPVDMLKIDQSLVKRIGPRGENTEIIKAITSFARNLNMDVIAEGVEEENQLIHLGNLNIKYMQGYCFSKPLDGLQIEALLRQVSCNASYDITRPLIHSENSIKT
jgi:diguanylate cyclase (GGDEF)-like protein/PAS domain S-box-containing protein